MGRAPPVERDLADIEAFPEFLDGGLNGPVVDDIAVGDLDEALLGPQVIGHPITVHPSGHAFFWDPEPRHTLDASMLSSGGNTSTNAVMSVVLARSRPP